MKKIKFDFFFSFKSLQFHCFADVNGTECKGSNELCEMHFFVSYEPLMNPLMNFNNFYDFIC